MLVALVSTYDLGRQPFGLASPAAWLQDAGFEVVCRDASRDRLDDDLLTRADIVGFFLPMHTATRLMEQHIRRARALNPDAHLCAYGVYARPNAAWLQSLGVQTVLGGEFEADLVRVAEDVVAGRARATGASGGDGEPIPRLAFRVPDRRSLPALRRYARLQMPDGSARVVGYTEASRGCKHLCRHCPVVPVYGGIFRVVSADVVLADIRQQVDAGAQHITFGDPDFFNGVKHAVKIVEAVAREFPNVSYDVTIKIEHLLRHARYLPALRDTNCLFVTSAVESIDDDVLRWLKKGHTRADFERAVALCREVGLGLAPTFIPFTPWTTVESYRELLDAIDELDLVNQVPSVQLTLRLLVTEGSGLLALPDLRQILGPFDPEGLVYPWRHRDSRVDLLQQQVTRVVQSMRRSSRSEVFEVLSAVASHGREEAILPRGTRPPRARTSVPYLNEPWYC